MFVVFGIALALWLALDRPPATPAPPQWAVASGRLEALPGPQIPDVLPITGLNPGAQLGADGLGCDESLSFAAVGGGYGRLLVVAPCRVGQRIVVEYGPLRFEEAIGLRGTQFALLPGLVVEQGAQVVFADGSQLSVPDPGLDLALVLGVAWHADIELTLQMEAFGQTVTERRPGFGKVHRYGLPDGARAEIYVAPAARQNGKVRSLVRVDDACGSNVELTAFDTIGGAVWSRPVILQGPDCPATGFELENLLDDFYLGVTP